VDEVSQRPLLLHMLPCTIDCQMRSAWRWWRCNVLQHRRHKETVTGV